MTDHRRGEDEDRPPSVRTLLTVLVTIVVVAVVAGVVVVVSLASGSTRTAANRLDVGDDPQLAIRSTDADVRLIEGTSSDVVIRAKVTSGVIKTSYELRRRGDEIEVVGGCMQLARTGMRRRRHGGGPVEAAGARGHRLRRRDGRRSP